MALYEYFCRDCKVKFEQITSSGDPDAGACPKCNLKNTERLISRFAVGGQGDLRESTHYHGCHAAQDHSHHHDHDHSHGDSDGKNDHDH